MTNKKKAKIVEKHLSKMRNKPKAILFTGKALDEIVLCLRSARRGTASQRDYLQGLVKKIKKQRGE